MPIIDRINVNGTSYDIADMGARGDVSTALTNADAAMRIAQNAVSYAAPQTISDEGKAIARANIGAAADADVDDLKSAVEHFNYSLSNLAPYNTSLYTVQYANIIDSQYSNDYAAQATGYGSGAPSLKYTLPSVPGISVGDIIYISAETYAEESTSGDYIGYYRPNIFGQSMSDQSGVTPNEWHLYQRRYTQTANTTNLINFRFNYKSASAATNNVMHLRNLVVINLTKTYGAGNEPTIEGMNAVISENGGYIDTLNLFDAKQITNDVDSLKASASTIDTNIFVDFENGFMYANPTKKNDGSEYSLNNNGTVVSVNSPCRAVDGDIIYTWGEFKVQSTASCSRMYVSKGGNESTTIEEPDNDTWYPMSARYNRRSSVTGVQFVGEWASNTRIYIYYKHVAAINLTQVFGKYNEPSRDLLDKYFYAVSQANAIDFTAINAKMLNLGDSTRKLSYPSGSYVLLDEEHNVKMGSMPDPNWSGWQEIGTYGQFNVANIPVYNKVHGTLETDGMISVLPIWGAWSEAASSGNTHHGGHVFHGWTTDRMHRLTMVQNIYSDDEAAVFNYIPGDKSETSEGVFLPLRLGADNVYKGMLIEPIYNPENLANYRMSRVTVYGRLNISKPQNYNSIPASANADGVKGDICADENYIYVCTAENTWKRIPLQAWT